MDTQFRNTFTYGPDISRISNGQAFDTCLNTRPGAGISQAIKPPDINIRFVKLQHKNIVAMRLHDVNIPLSAVLRLDQPKSRVRDLERVFLIDFAG
ncbi:MAG: hypothetical protein OXN26_10225, partial [Gammaproteobacteria bacterium]|nr:hypothetical protein [Gammaproteobacteria bacterium]